MNRAMLLVCLQLLSACSCSKSHSADGGVDAAAFDEGADVARDTLRDPSPPNDTLPDMPDTPILDTGASCDRIIDLEWTMGTPMPVVADSRIVIMDSARVSVIGDGAVGRGIVQSYHIDRNEWTELRLPIQNGTGDLLPSGEILIAGSVGRIARDWPQDGTIDWVQLFDPNAGTYRDTTFLNASRGFHSSVLLDDGRVLVAGGWHRSLPSLEVSALRSTEVYDRSGESWTVQGEMAFPRWAFSLTRLQDGRVLAVGGFDASGASAARQASAEIFNPTTRSWTTVASLNEGRAWHEAQLLPSGRVLVVGGENQAGDVLASSELYDPITDTWTAGPSLPEGAEDMASLVLPSGRVLVAGGFRGLMMSIDQVNLYDESADCWQPLPPLNTARWHFGLVRLPNGRIMAPGGWTDRGATASVEMTSVALD